MKKKQKKYEKNPIKIGNENILHFWRFWQEKRIGLAFRGQGTHTEEV